MVRNMAMGWVLLGASSAWAHPGHGGVDSNTPLHYVLTLEHAIPLTILGIAAIGFGVAVWRSYRKKTATGRI